MRLRRSESRTFRLRFTPVVHAFPPCPSLSSTGTYASAMVFFCGLKSDGRPSHRTGGGPTGICVTFHHRSGRPPVFCPVTPRVSPCLVTPTNAPPTHPPQISPPSPPLPPPQRQDSLRRLVWQPFRAQRHVRGRCRRAVRGGSHRGEGSGAGSPAPSVRAGHPGRHPTHLPRGFLHGGRVGGGA